MAFDQTKFEALRSLAEALPPDFETSLKARWLLMLCDEIARLQSVPEETKPKECDLSQMCNCPQCVPQENIAVTSKCDVPRETACECGRYSCEGCQEESCRMPEKNELGEKK